MSRRCDQGAEGRGGLSRARAGRLAAPATQAWAPSGGGRAKRPGAEDVAWSLRGLTPVELSAWQYVWARDDAARHALFAALLLVAERWAREEGWLAVPDPCRAGRRSLRLRAMVDLTLDELRLGLDALAARTEVERYTRVGIPERSWRRTWRARQARLAQVARRWLLEGQNMAIPGQVRSEV